MITEHTYHGQPVWRVTANDPQVCVLVGSPISEHLPNPEYDPLLFLRQPSSGRSLTLQGREGLEAWYRDNIATLTGTVPILELVEAIGTKLILMHKEQ